MSYVPPWSDRAFSGQGPTVQGSQTLNQVREIDDEVDAFLAYQEEKAEIENRAYQILPGAVPTSVPSAGNELVRDPSVAVSLKLTQPPLRRTNDRTDYAPSHYKPAGPWPRAPAGGDLIKPTKLSKDAKAKLVTDVMETVDMDNLLLMQKLKERVEAVGLKTAGVEVRFTNITASANVYVGARSIPTLPNAALIMAEFLLTPITYLINKTKKDTKRLVMLDNVSGVLKPGRLTLLLGPPGAGKSTLLRVLSGQMKDSDVKVEGLIEYNGVPMKDFVVERTAAYIDQVDKHIGDMTVRETMAFGARMTGQGFSSDPMIDIIRAKEKELGIVPDPKLDELATHVYSVKKGDNIIVDIIARLLGLEVCMETYVGNDLLKGISGGQKKRVTTAEMQVGRYPVMFMDEISTGLDSASTFLITKSLKNLCAFMNVNIIVALLQPSPEVYDIFDDILLMGDAKILYHGPREEILPFFETLGLSCPVRKGVADYLQEVTSRKDQPQYFKDTSQSHDFITTQGISDAFKSSEQGKARAEEHALNTNNRFSDLDMSKLAKHRFALSTYDSLNALWAREHLLILRMKAFVIIRALQTVIVAVLVGTSFLQLSKDSLTNANYFMSVAFFSLLYMMLGGFAEVPIFIQRLPVFYKQRNYNFYPAWCYCFAGALVRIPDNILMATLWTVIVYWAVGFYASAGQFFIFYFIMVSMSIFSTAIFRTLASFCRDETIAQAVGAFILVLTINTAGFTITRTDIPPWWIWMYWISPLAYAIRAMLVNEMNTPDWSLQVPTSEGEVSLGIFVMELRGFQTQTWWAWVGIGVLLGAAILLTAIQALFITYLDALKGSGGAVANDEEEEEKERAKESEMKAARGDVEEGPKKGESGLAFVPFSLAFRDIKYYVPKPGGKAGEELCLLQGISGCFRPGVLTALMGASGAGKTTLMDVLAGRKTGGRMEGSQLLNGHPKVQATFARVMGYVEQFDIHSPQSKVYEALLFSGRMRLPQEMGREAVTKFVDEVMDLVELHPLKDAMIGLSGVSGLSVEQRKRLTIAVELVANPSVVFMDEPTSGLDARAAAIVMRVVRNTVNTGRTVVCTIHQPSLDIFQAFDELLLLKRGGETIFFGNMGPEQVNLIQHFESVEGVAKFVPGYNPANWMLEVTAPGAEGALGVDFAKIYRESPLNTKNEALLDEVCQHNPDSTPLHFDTKFAVPTSTQFKLILDRNFVTYWRSPNYNLIRIMITIGVGLIFGSLYWDIGTNRTSTVAVLNIMGALYSSAVFMGVANAMTVMPVIQNERVVYYREKAAGTYAAWPYAVAQGLVELPYLIAQSIIYALLIYWMIGFQADAAKFFWFLLFLFLNFCALTFFGMMAINLTPAVQFGTVFVAFFFTAWNLFCGFLQAQPNIPGWWIWIHYIDPISYTLYGLVVSQLGDVTDEYIDISVPPEPPEIVSVAQYMQDAYGYKHSMVGWLVLILIAFIVCFRAVSIIALFRLNFQKR